MMTVKPLATSRISYTCSVEDHRKRPSRIGFGTLTVHEGGWAYCVADVMDGHAWNETGDVTFETLLMRNLSAARS